VRPSFSPAFSGEDTLTRRRRLSQDGRTSPPFVIVVVDDDPAMLRLFEKVLDSKENEVICCTTAAEALEVLEHQAWDLCLLDRGLPDLDGIEICRRIKADPRFDARQLIMVSGYGSLDARVEALDLGADDYITKPFQIAELLARVNASRRIVEMQKHLVAMADQLEELSMRDGLTGMFNRRHFGTALSQAFEYSTRYGRPLSVAIIDVDCFKNINDSLGHDAGDRVLMELAKRFTQSVRASDYVARYGGEEFVILLPEARLHDALTFSEKLRQAVAGAPVEVAGGIEVPVTISVGTASLAHTQFSSASEMIAAADKALYRAKRNGRDRVEAERRRAKRTAA
jgi:two-component system, cell cycle response regulator